MLIHSTSGASVLRIGFTDHDRGAASLVLREKFEASGDFSVSIFMTLFITSIFTLTADAEECFSELVRASLMLSVRMFHCR